MDKQHDQAIEVMDELAKKLIEQHWNYVDRMLLMHGIEQRDRLLAEQHYTTAGLHFFKHAVEALLERDDLPFRAHKNFMHKVWGDESPVPGSVSQIPVTKTLNKTEDF